MHPHSLNATKYCREKGLSRQTVWWANREQILDERNESLDNWLRGWLICRQITLKVFSGEAGAADYSVRKEWLETTFVSLLKRYNTMNIWNAYECGLFYTQISKSTYCQTTEKPLGGKVELSLMLATSVTGQKRRHLIIHRGKSLLSVNPKSSHPSDYQSQKKERYIGMDAQFIRQDRDTLTSLFTSFRLAKQASCVPITPKNYTYFRKEECNYEVPLLCSFNLSVVERSEY